jgi:hypothetical protein
MAQHDLELKRKLVEATEAVRKKFKQIKSSKIHGEIELDKFYEPIKTPLTNITDLMKHQTSAQQQQQQQQQQQSIKKQIVKPYATHIKLSHSLPNIANIQQTGPKQTSTPLHYTMPLPSSSSSFLKEDLPGSVTPILHKDSSSDAENTVTSQTSDIYSTPVKTDFATPNRPITRKSPKNIIKHYIEQHNKKPSNFDEIYGIRFDSRNKHIMRIGNADIRFDNGKVLLLRNNKRIGEYEGNSQLYDLLFMKSRSQIRDLTDNVIQAYKDILLKSNSIYKDYDKKKGLVETRWPKYKYFIKPLIEREVHGSGSKKIKTLSKLPSNKIVSKSKTEYVYWNKPKELVARLRLLYSSKMAGHTGHDNEIISIIEELREEGIIY